MNDDIDPTLAALERASEALREANHRAYDPPVTPQSLYRRAGVVTELLQRMGQVIATLSSQAEDADVRAGSVLASDDEVPAAQHVDQARGTLWLAADGVANASQLADRAHGSLSHLKYQEM